MGFKDFFLDVLNRTVNASWYRTVGCSPEEASFLADMEANMSVSNRTTRELSDENFEKHLATSRTHYHETMAALAERRHKLYEKNPWLLEKHQNGKD